jgi:hypothetical protein|tara:strand:- start:156 stop:368 length:213 start_codon:yes stop_codon:yes gene_type:complete
VVEVVEVVKVDQQQDQPLDQEEQVVEEQVVDTAVKFLLQVHQIQVVEVVVELTLVTFQLVLELEEQVDQV